MKYLSCSIQETFQIASDFSQQLKGGELIALRGDLGAGKTHFVKGMGKSFSIPEEEISSPTFSLIQIYSGTRNLVHLDLYRLETVSELLELGLEDYRQSSCIVVVEWAEKFLEYLKPNYSITIKSTHMQAKESREIEIIHERS